MYSSEERKQSFRIFLYFRMVLCSKDWNCSLNLYSWSAPCKIPVPPLTINKSGTCRSYVQIKMPFANFFRKSAGTCSSPRPALHLQHLRIQPLFAPTSKPYTSLFYSRSRRTTHSSKWTFWSATRTRSVGGRCQRSVCGLKLFPAMVLGHQQRGRQWAGQRHQERQWVQ